MKRAILIIGGGYYQIPAVQEAHRQGLHVICTDRNPNCLCAGLADEMVALDIRDAQGHVKLVRDLMRRSDIRLAGVLVEGVSVEYVGACAARAAGLPGLDPVVAYRCYNKAETRKRLTAAGFVQPRYAEVATARQAEEFAVEVGFPLIVKPLDSSASRGTTKVHDLWEVKAAVERALPVSTTGTAIIEECWPQGPEQTVQVIFDEHGHGHPLCIGDRDFLDVPEYALEEGILVPSVLPETVQRRIFEITFQAADAMGVNWGVFKADTMIVDSEPRVLEVTCRLGGGDGQVCPPLAFGANYVKAALDLSLGKPLEPADITPRYHRYSARVGSYPPAGVIRRIDGVEQARQLPGVHDVVMRLEVGEVIGPATNCADRGVIVVTDGATPDEARQRARLALQMIQFDVVPVE